MWRACLSLKPCVLSSLSLLDSPGPCIQKALNTCLLTSKKSFCPVLLGALPRDYQWILSEPEQQWGGGGEGERAPTDHFHHRGNFPHPKMLSQSLRQEISRNLLTIRMTRPPTVAAQLCSHYGLCHTWPTPTPTPRKPEDKWLRGVDVHPLVEEVTAPRWREAAGPTISEIGVF